ncbi:kinase-like domain-containing protein [Gigaspora rosea]|uniref:Kinase-like domain-containing protein n=1 Tax=Gigaspora rosea TaxID=44941 RepID=A0A397VZZ0_9GLOM|nr:kinase-like domain-containing protein [Gigaspora rosea]
MYQNCKQCTRTSRTRLYCEHCVKDGLVENFGKWTSGNSILDSIIQKTQIAIPYPGNFPEWIPYKHISNIKYKTKGGFALIQTAKWQKGVIKDFSAAKKTFYRDGPMKVCLKHLKGSNVADDKYMTEVQIHFSLSSIPVDITWLLGVTIDPHTKDFILVLMPEESNLWEILSDPENKYTWRQVFDLLLYICGTLKVMHENNITHRDLHPGNILQTAGMHRLSDFGLSAPANMPSDGVYGNMPFIAPELFKKQPYTPSSDIYSISIIMWTLASSSPPFSEKKHDNYLIFEILDGLRPPTIKWSPTSYNNLMQRCWDSDPNKRPSTTELHVYFDNILYDEISNPTFINQIVRRSAFDVKFLQKFAKSSVYIFESLDISKRDSYGRFFFWI